MAAPERRIERLVVRVPGLSADAATRLGRRIAENLGRTELAPTQGAPRHVARIEVRAGGDESAIARAVVDAIRGSVR